MASTRKYPWTPEEDEAINELVDIYGEENWKSICIELTQRKVGPERSCKQCRERWLNNLSPNVKKGSWSEWEKQTLFACHQKFGNKWSKIAEYLPGRTDNAIKNFFYGTVRKALKTYNKLHRDDCRILRTLKSLIRDKQVTKILCLTADAEPPQEHIAPAAGDVVAPPAAWPERTHHRWWYYMQWLTAPKLHYALS